MYYCHYCYYSEYVRCTLGVLSLDQRIRTKEQPSLWQDESDQLNSRTERATEQTLWGRAGLGSCGGLPYLSRVESAIYTPE